MVHYCIIIESIRVGFRFKEYRFGLIIVFNRYDCFVFNLQALTLHMLIRAVFASRAYSMYMLHEGYILAAKVCLLMTLMLITFDIEGLS